METEDFQMVDSNTLVKYDNDIFGAFEVTRVISNTQNGIIYESKRRTNDCQLVIKQVSKKSVRNYYVIHGQPCPAEFVYHFTASAKNNQYIIRPHEWIEGDESYIMVMERRRHMIDLFEASQKYGIFSDSFCRSVLRQIIKATQHCIKVGILHRDIKDENVLVDLKTGEARLIDFGCATEVREEYNVFCGTGEYYPPEWYNTGRYTPGPLCVWQLGCLLYILLCGSIPFEKEDIPEASRDHKYEKHLSWEAADAIDQMLHPDPQKRVLLENVFDLPFFKQS
jgi:proto-oncogene serine/threonine-protein kinase Pim-3